jgi:hypothetical protein
MNGDLDELAGAAADFLVSAMLTGSWPEIRQRFAALIGHEQRMEAGRAGLVTAADADRDRMRLDLVAAWRTRLRDSLDDHPSLAGDLRVLTAGLDAAGRTEVPAAQHAHAEHDSQAVNVGGSIAGNTGEVYVGVGKIDKRKINIALAPFVFFIRAVSKIGTAHPAAATVFVVLAVATLTGWQTHWPGAIFGTSGPSALTTADSPGNAGNAGNGGAPADSVQPTGDITPGHMTPQDAVAGLIQGELAGDWSQACSYLAPEAQASCDQQAPQLSAFTGNATVDGAMVSGTEALVEVTGSMCGAGAGCSSNGYPSTGMPDSQAGFGQVYDQLVSSSGSSSFSPVPAIEENGLWYVNYPQ